MIAILKIVLLLGSVALIADAGPLEDEAAQKVAKLDSKAVERLRHMFRDSHKLASESLYEWIVLNHLKRKNEDERKHEGAIVGQSGESTNSDKVTVHRDSRDGSDSSEYLISKQVMPIVGENKQQSAEQVAREAAEKLPTELIVENVAPVASHDDKNPDKLGETNDARQTNLFSAFRYPPGHLGAFSLGQSPISGALLTSPMLPKLPTMANIHTLPIITPTPAKPAKNSVIGNTGGPMALTNDNVVVVNVLSNNY